MKTWIFYVLTSLDAEILRKNKRYLRKYTPPIVSYYLQSR